MVGHDLGVDLHLATCDAAAARNLMLVIERCHLRVEAMVATPYAAGLSTLVDDEAELGAAVVDFGGGSTTVGVFSGGRLIHVDAVALGGSHVTRDVARGLNVAVSDAERLKTLYGACIASASDDRETISVQRLGDDQDHPSHLSKSELVRIIRPRVEEILELVRDRLRASGYAAQAGRRLVMTGGACQLTGLPELTRTTISNQARVGRPLGIEGLPESGKSPSFAAAVGLMVYPQMAGLEYFGTTRSHAGHQHGEAGYATRVGRWLKESF
jgi:cell division protein FtsA